MDAVQPEPWLRALITTNNNQQAATISFHVLSYSPTILLLEFLRIEILTAFIFKS
jgi:hypothetical protein